jgi:dihydroorotate dehydrogenase electron transfer subunit
MDVVEITGIKNECKNIKTIRFNLKRNAVPGQFVMVWIPGIDEVPMSLSYLGEAKGITVEERGEASNALHRLKIGGKIGIRGPYGNGFRLTGRKILVISGGSGMPPLAAAIDECIKEEKKATCIIGARSRDGILFAERIKKAGCTVHIATDDGSLGHRGFATELAEIVLKKEKFDLMLACGPERMLVSVLKLAGKFKIPAQASLERYMKCGMGLCGSCQIGKYLVCRDGPVFDGKTLAGIEDFGKFKRDASGKKVILG